MSRVRAVSLLVIALALIAFAAAKLAPRPNSTACLRCNVILISLDTVGENHTSLDGPSASTTPALAARASKEGVVFDNAYSAAPWELPSEAALLTGQYPWDLDVWDITDALPAGTYTLAEALHDRGYQTAAFSSGAYVQPQWGFARGFDSFSSNLQMSSWYDAPVLFGQANAWLSSASKGKPFFLFINTFEAHDPFYPPGTPGGITTADIVAANTQPGGATASETQTFLTAYEARVRTDDDALKSLFDTVDSLGLASTTLIIVTADNGEEFGEHGTVAFHVSPYRETMRVPLVVFLPGAPATRVSASVETRSVFATVLDALGFSPGPGGAPSLLPYVTGTDTANQLVLMQSGLDRAQSLANVGAAQADLLPRVGVNLTPLSRSSPYQGPRTTSAIVGDWQALKLPDGNLELYDMSADPEETTNVLTGSNAPSGNSNAAETLNALVTAF